MIAEISSRFITLPAGEVDREIEDALHRISEPLGIELAVLWQWSLVDSTAILPTHAYCIEASLRPSTPMSQEQYPWSVRQVLAGRMIAITSPDALPSEAAVDRETCRQYGIKSALCLPLSLGGEQTVGALGFNALRRARNWPDALVQQLQLVAQVFTNVLVRRRHEQRLQKSQALLAAGSELAGIGFYEVDFVEGVANVDGRMRELLGIHPSRTQGMQALSFWMEHLHPDDRERVLDRRRQLHDGSLKELGEEYRFLHPTRGEIWIHHLARVVSRDAAGLTLKSYGALRDITQAKRVEEELRDLSRRLIRAHEEERSLLARELHDDVTQRLAVLAIEVGRAELAASAGAQGEAMRSVHAELVRLSEDVHSLAYQLHPSVLEELGLVEALRAECERRGRQGRLDLTVNLESSPAVVGKDAELCLFRVAQEALTNAARHAGTRAVSVTLRQMDGGLVLAMRDGGVGFDPDARRERMHLGLASMRERVRLVGGTLEIESAPGAGTAIIAWVPVIPVAGKAP